MSISTPSAPLDAQLGAAARTFAVPSLVVADQSGLVVASAPQGSMVDEVAALSALRASGHNGRAEVVDGRVKARQVQVGEEVLVLGAIGDTAICSAVFDEVESAVQNTLT